MSRTAAPIIRFRFTLMLIIAFALAFVWTTVLPVLSGGGPSKTMRIVSNLRQIEVMKEMWASDHGVTGAVRVTELNLAPYAYGYSSNRLARPVAGERYVIHRLGVGPEALLTQAYGKLPAGTVIRLRPEPNRLFRVLLPNEQGRARGWQPVTSTTNSSSAAAASRRLP
jgi:hypothetical protein